MSRASFSIFFTAFSSLWNAQNLCSTMVAGILYCNIFLFPMQLLWSRPIAQNVKVIVEMTQPNKHQSRTVGQIVKLPSSFMHCGAKF